MQFWQTLWKLTFFIGVGLFSIMAVWVSVQGARDIKSLFKTLDEEHRQSGEEEGSVEY
jgi:hypothetical protein